MKTILSAGRKATPRSSLLLNTTAIVLSSFSRKPTTTTTVTSFPVHNYNQFQNQHQQRSFVSRTSFSLMATMSNTNTDNEGVDKKRKVSPFGGTPIDDDANEKYVPPKIWKWDHPDPESVNQPTAGNRYKQELPVGKHPLQLYSMGTPNGQKVTIMLEELLEAGFKGAEYDAWLIKIINKEQFSSGFVDINPNSKIPALVDRSTTKEGGDDDGDGDGDSKDEIINVFESGSILLYLAEKFDNAFLPTDPMKRAQTMNWLFWNVGSAPYVGNFGHFYHYAPTKQRYPMDRFTMETKRLLDVLNQHLKDNEYLAGDEYTIADIANWPWYAGVLDDSFYPNAAEFLNVEEEYPYAIRWAKKIGQRPAVKRGKIVNKFWGEPSEQLAERHDSSDFELRTADKLEQSSK
mmetsp:Transcript_27209/g.65118  ORF Transcript_27209/g.65118 Transcript_27209/m.65118 type:complete len:404 (-) Transcript_27209:2526-3737(-)